MILSLEQLRRIIEELDLVARLQQLAFDVEELFQEAWAIFVQRKHAFINGNDPQRCGCRITLCVRDGEIQLGDFSRPIDRLR